MSGNKLRYDDDVTGSDQAVRGSDNRLNTSGRVDSRAYYNSRDRGQCYSVTFDHTTAADGEYSLYLKNTATANPRTLVISSVGVNATNIARFKFWRVTGTAANGVARIPTNQNFASPNDAEVICLHDGGGTTISGLTTSGIELDDIQIQANSHAEIRTGDRIRLGQNEAVAIELDTATSTPNAFGVLFFYFE